MPLFYYLPYLLYEQILTLLLICKLVPFSWYQTTTGTSSKRKYQIRSPSSHSFWEQLSSSAHLLLGNSAGTRINRGHRLRYHGTATSSLLLIAVKSRFLKSSTFLQYLLFLALVNPGNPNTSHKIQSIQNE